MGDIYKCESCNYEIYVGIPQLFVEHELNRIMAQKHPDLKRDTLEYTQVRFQELAQWEKEYFSKVNCVEELPESCPMCGKAGLREQTSFT